MAEPDGDILTLDEVAAYLKAGKRTIYRLAASGEIPAFKLGGTWRFSRSDIESWIKEQSAGRPVGGGGQLYYASAHPSSLLTLCRDVRGLGSIPCDLC